MSDGAVKQEPAAAHGMNGTATQEEEVRLMTEEELEREKMRPPDIDQDMKVIPLKWHLFKPPYRSCDSMDEWIMLFVLY